MKTDHWFYGLFQSAPDLIALLLPSVDAAGASAAPFLGPDSPGDALYCFEAPELKAANHRLDGAFWPRGATFVKRHRKLSHFRHRKLRHP